MPRKQFFLNGWFSYNYLLIISWEELTHWKRLWCWEGLGAEGEGDNRGWDGWMASPTRWTWVWVNSRRSGVLRFMELQRDVHDWRLNWTELNVHWCIEAPLEHEFTSATPKSLSYFRGAISHNGMDGEMLIHPVQHWLGQSRGMRLDPIFLLWVPATLWRLSEMERKN